MQRDVERWMHLVWQRRKGRVHETSDRHAELGATGGDVKIIEWLVAEGAPVKAGQALFVVETDKATSEVEAFREGFWRR